MWINVNERWKKSDFLLNKKRHFLTKKLSLIDASNVKFLLIYLQKLHYIILAALTTQWPLFKESLGNKLFRNKDWLMRESLFTTAVS